MTISKTTINYAVKRNLDVTVCEYENELLIWEGDNECEPAVSYMINENGSFTYRAISWLSQEIKEELPATINNEKHLREVLNFLAAELAA